MFEYIVESMSIITEVMLHSLLIITYYLQMSLNYLSRDISNSLLQFTHQVLQTWPIIFGHNCSTVSLIISHVKPTFLFNSSDV